MRWQGATQARKLADALITSSQTGKPPAGSPHPDPPPSRGRGRADGLCVTSLRERVGGCGFRQILRAALCGPSAQLLPRDRDAVQQAAFAVIVVDREVPGRAVVPEGEGPFPPLETAGEFGPHRVAVEVVEQGP